MPEITPSKYLVNAGWQDVPHLDEKTKEELRRSTPPYLRDAVEFGLPNLSAGAIWPVPEADIKVEPFAIPKHWPRCYALDVGWKRTACLWLAWDRAVDVVYAYTEHYRGQAEPSIHAAAIRARGGWIPGVIDPASRGRSQIDGERLIELYRENGLNLQPANNEREAGLYAVWERLSTSRLKIFSTCQNWWAEWRNYHRDEKGSIVKVDDHLMDTTRYGIMSGLAIAVPEPVEIFTGVVSSGDPTVAY